MTFEIAVAAYARPLRGSDVPNDLEGVILSVVPVLRHITDTSGIKPF